MAGHSETIRAGGAGYVAAWMLCAGGAPALAAQLTTIDAQAHYPEGPLWRDGRLLL